MNLTLEKLTENINNLAQATRTASQWIPAHTEIMGNKMGNQLASEGSKNTSSHLTDKAARALFSQQSES